MSDEPTQAEIDAIQSVILSGVAGDFHDVANIVNDRHGLQVGAILVEAVYRRMQDARDASAVTPQDSGEELLRKVLRFAQEMGGFDPARAALDAVEEKLREIDKPEPQ